MFGNRLGVNALLMATVLALGASISMPAFAQNSTEGSIETEIAYRIYCCGTCERLFLFEADLKPHQDNDGHSGVLLFSWSSFFGDKYDS